MKKNDAAMIVDLISFQELKTLRGYGIKRIFLFFVVSIVFLISGCATPMKMGLGKGTERIDLKEESILLMSVELVNEYKPNYQPEAYVLHIDKLDNQGKEDRLNYAADEEGTTKSDNGNKYIFRITIKDGKYIIRGVTGFSGILTVTGTFFMPLHSEIEVKNSSVLYLGHIIGKIRERKENEFRAGGVTPLINQAIPGFSGGTFDVNVIDNYEEDLKVMTALFPALASVQVKSAILAPFDRAKAQKWWENH